MRGADLQAFTPKATSSRSEGRPCPDRFRVMGRGDLAACNPIAHGEVERNIGAGFSLFCCLFPLVLPCFAFCCLFPLVFFGDAPPKKRNMVVFLLVAFEPHPKMCPEHKSVCVCIALPRCLLQGWQCLAVLCRQTRCTAADHESEHVIDTAKVSCSQLPNYSPGIWICTRLLIGCEDFCH